MAWIGQRQDSIHDNYYYYFYSSNRTHVELFTLLPLCLNYLDVAKINCKSDTLTFLETHDEMLETQPILSMDIMTAKGKR